MPPPNADQDLPEGGDAALLDGLARRIQSGDHDAFMALVEATERDLRIFATIYATSLSMVDEVVQATYVTCFQSIANYQPRGTLRAWLKGIARHKLLKDLRERSRQCSVDGEVLEQLLAQAGSRDLEQPDDGTEERVARLQACLEELAPEARRLIRERYYEDRAVNDIARLLERSASWVAVTLFRIRKTLLVCIRQGGAA
ncbi:MAG: sigma-70 family RNA polymerase sigma factor [Planctomycetes bacterium]|nr:sigma-70 family RNA polymerase sigma factor [Planctomycetota bacterium]